MDHTIPQPLQLTIHPANAAAKPSGFWQEDGPSFKDMLDTINPLQHIPIISNLYRSITGDDKPSTGAKMAGDVLFGGPLGLLSSIFNSIVETETGTDIGGNILSLITGDATSSPQQQTANNETATPEHYTSASQHTAVNAYVSVQNRLL